MLTSDTLIKWATNCGIPYEFADYWSEVYLETRDEISKIDFLNWISEKYHARRAREYIEIHEGDDGRVRGL
jgi:hypothetical protein